MRAATGDIQSIQQWHHRYRCRPQQGGQDRAAGRAFFPRACSKWMRSISPTTSARWWKNTTANGILTAPCT